MRTSVDESEPGRRSVSSATWMIMCCDTTRSAGGRRGIVEGKCRLGQLQHELRGLLAPVFCPARSRLTAFAHISALLAERPIAGRAGSRPALRPTVTSARWRTCSAVSAQRRIALSVTVSALTACRFQRRTRSCSSVPRSPNASLPDPSLTGRAGSGVAASPCCRGPRARSGARGAGRGPAASIRPSCGRSPR